MLDVWKALFLREALFRLFMSRGAWAWLVIEPIANFSVIMALRSFLGHGSTTHVDGGVWALSGLMGFYMARNTASQAMEAINANKALFTYRQVKPVDTVLVRAALEGLLLLVNAVLLFCGAGLFGLPVVPHSPIIVIWAVLGLWLLGVGLGLIFSVLEELNAEIGKIIKISFYPLFLLSGIFLSPSVLPKAIRDIMILNPFLHGVELVRVGFFAVYRADEFVSFFYLYSFSLAAGFLGLVLHVHYAKRLAAP